VLLLDGTALCSYVYLRHTSGKKKRTGLVAPELVLLLALMARASAHNSRHLGAAACLLTCSWYVATHCVLQDPPEGFIRHTGQLESQQDSSYYNMVV
jgi:hypothetical protein